MPTSTPPGGAAHRLYLSQLAIYLLDSRQILDAWDIYSDEHSDPETFQPFDESAYGRRQSQRDSDTLAAFGRVYYHADDLVEIAEQQLAYLPTSDLTRRCAWQLTELRTSTEALYAVHNAWRNLHAKLPPDAVPGTEAHDGPLAESYAEAWHYLDQWALHGQVLIEINVLAQRQGQNGSPAPSKAPPHPDTVTKPSSARR